MRKQILFWVLALLPLSVFAQEQDVNAAPDTLQTHPSGVFTGFSGGMMIHGGYLFANDPTRLFGNTALGNEQYVNGLPTAGFCFGLGGTLRIHLKDHIHIGGEGFVSTMPLMEGSGSNIRIGWGGAMCDVYANWGKVHPLIGLTIGGGAMRRLYAPDTNPVTYSTETDTTIYNASYVKTPFFMIDPYVGMEIELNSHMALLIRVDYALPFNTKNHGLTKTGQEERWESFVRPNGPRLYIGIMFGRMKRE